MSCFGEYLAEIAGEGGDVSAPVPRMGRRWRHYGQRAIKANCPASVMAAEYTKETHFAGGDTTEAEGTRLGVGAPGSPGDSPATN